MLVGRRTEQQAIERLISAARLGAGGVLAITGEPGVGKTALLRQAASGVGGMRILRATGVEAEREIPFALLSQLLGPALGGLDGIPDAQADALAAALALPRAQTTPVDRFAVGAGALSLLCRYAEDGPTAVLVDDLQFADEASATALGFAARRLTVDPIIVLLAVRTPEGDRFVDGLPRLDLAGLDLDEATELLARSGRSEAGIGALHRATGGNPLALLELDSRVIEPGVDADAPLHLPHALASAFGRRVADLGAAAREVLLVAAVCGSDLGLVGRACHALGLDPVLLGEAEEMGLVTVRGDVVEFRHPLVRSAVYTGAAAGRRHAVHRAAAEALSPGDVDRRAWHWAEAVWHPDAAVADLLAQAGDNARSRGAYASASGAFERAARRCPDADGRQGFLLDAADMAWTAGAGDRARSLLDERARERVGTVEPDDVRAVELRASIAARTGSLVEARDTLLAAADAMASDGRPDDAAVALADAVHAAFYLADARTAAVVADRLAAEQNALRSPRARALSLMATGMARVLAGSGGADEIRAAAPLLADAGLRRDPRRLSWLLLVPLFLREAEGGRWLRDLVDEVRGEAGIGALPAVLFHVGRDESTTGASWARAAADYGESIRLAAETGQMTEMAMSLAGLAWLDSRAGRADACRRHAARAHELCAERGIRIGEIWVAHALGDLDLSEGLPAEALERFSALTRLLERLGLDDVDLSPAPESVDALQRLGRRSDAAAIAMTFLGRAEAKAQPWALARANRAMGLVADDFDPWFAHALRRHEQTPDRFESARTRLAYGERLRRAGRRIDARIHLRDAHGTFTALGAIRWADRAGTELAATGEHVRSRDADPLADLTPQELQVSILLADGRSTREAAAALFLSPKTVEYHLRKVYTKLGIGSRAELAQRVPH